MKFLSPTSIFLSAARVLSTFKSNDAAMVPQRPEWVLNLEFAANICAVLHTGDRQDPSVSLDRFACMVQLAPQEWHDWVKFIKAFDDEVELMVRSTRHVLAQELLALFEQDAHC